MTVAVASFVFLLAAVCAALMGYAIQRGATCTVAAVGEIVREGTTKRLVALAETSLWVAGGLLTARALGFLAAVPGGFALSGWTVLGAALLGIGAYVNKACVFGAIAKLGSGQWAYVLTPLGFFIGAASAPLLFSQMTPATLDTIPTSSSLPLWLAPAFLVFALWRIINIARTDRPRGKGWQRIWAPHEATIVIGVAFVIMFIAVGAWSYMDMLVHIVHGMSDNLFWQGLLFCALLMGAIIGGWTGGVLSWQNPTLVTLARCLLGGLLMGWGSLLIPGSNDGLILIGLPFLWPYAWVSILVMCVVIWLCFIGERTFTRR
ncbi:MAG: YeeE/YedE thiosulfate transporter family protein [Sphingomonadaceae bacterium]